MTFPSVVAVNWLVLYPKPRTFLVFLLIFLLVFFTCTHQELIKNFAPVITSLYLLWLWNILGNRSHPDCQEYFLSFWSLPGVKNLFQWTLNWNDHRIYFYFTLTCRFKIPVYGDLESLDGNLLVSSSSLKRLKQYHGLLVSCLSTFLFSSKAYLYSPLVLLLSCSCLCPSLCSSSLLLVFTPVFACHHQESTLHILSEVAWHRASQAEKIVGKEDRNWSKSRQEDASKKLNWIRFPLKNHAKFSFSVIRVWGYNSCLEDRHGSYFLYFILLSWKRGSPIIISLSTLLLSLPILLYKFEVGKEDEPSDCKL